MEEVKEYTTERVDPKDFVSGWLMAIIIAGTALSLPILYLGAEIALSIGFTNALLAFIISTLVLSFVSAFTTLVGNRTHLSTYMILHFSFGKYGAATVNFMFGLILIGWFSVSLELLAIAISDTALNTFELQLSNQLIIVLSSLFITLTTLFGINSIQRLANFTIPVLTVFFGYVLTLSFQDYSLEDVFNYAPASATMTLFEAVSILVGSSILFPVLMADFSRFMKDDKQSLISILGLIIGTPIALIFGAIPAIQTGEVDIIKIMASYDLVIPAFVLLFISTWMANTLNLYSATLTFSSIKPQWSYRKVVVFGSVFGTIIACFGFSEFLFSFLELLGVFTPAIAAIYLLNFFWVKKQIYIMNEIKAWEINALFSWCLASIFSSLTYLDYLQLTSIYFLDAFLIGAFCYLIMIKIVKL